MKDESMSEKKEDQKTRGISTRNAVEDAINRSKDPTATWDGSFEDELKQVEEIVPTSQNKVRSLR